MKGTLKKQIETVDKFLATKHDDGGPGIAWKTAREDMIIATCYAVKALSKEVLNMSYSEFHSRFPNENFMDEGEFLERTGIKPEGDDLTRVNCPYAGEIGHRGCGWCDVCNQPKFICVCPEKGKIIFRDGTLDEEKSDMEFYNRIKHGKPK